MCVSSLNSLQIVDALVQERMLFEKFCVTILVVCVVCSLFLVCMKIDVQLIDAGVLRRYTWVDYVPRTSVTRAKTSWSVHGSAWSGPEIVLRCLMRFVFSNFQNGERRL